MTPEEKQLIKAIDDLENELASYFVDKDIPMSISRAVGYVEVALIEAGFSPLKISGIDQRKEVINYINRGTN